MSRVSRAALTGIPGSASPSAVAQALADAFLASGEWSPAALHAAGSACVGAPRRFVPLAVTVALVSYRRPPRDAPRELARALLTADGFARAVEQAGRKSPVRILMRQVTATEASAPDDRLPRVDTIANLARVLEIDIGHLDWFADTRRVARRATDDRLDHYHYAWRARPGRTPRLLEAPRPRLREIQRRLLDTVLAEIPCHDAAHGFVPGRSVLTGAAHHTGREVVVGLDLVAFFAGVTAKRIFGVLRRAGLPEPVAYTLTGLGTHVVPGRVIAAMPAGGGVDEGFALRQALAVPHLPQGAPSSPALANLALRRLDSRLNGWAESAGAVCTRYADDLTFSGDRSLASRVDSFVRGVERIVVDDGHLINSRKTRVRRRGVRQSVTGVVVNDRLSPGRAEFNRLKAILHSCVLHGPAGQDRAGHADFAAHLAGRVGWFEQVHPARGLRLRREWERIDWG